MIALGSGSLISPARARISSARIRQVRALCHNVEVTRDPTLNITATSPVFSRSCVWLIAGRRMNEHQLRQLGDAHRDPWAQKARTRQAVYPGNESEAVCLISDLALSGHRAAGRLSASSSRKRFTCAPFAPRRADR